MITSRLRLMYRLVGGTASLLLIVMVGIVVAWFVLGGRVYSVQTGSMQPELSPGDAVLVWPTSLLDLRVGQVISFRDKAEPNLITTHRITKIDKQVGILTTRGDNTAQTDLPVTNQQIIGRTIAVAPSLGRALSWLRTPIGLVVAVYIPAVAILLGEVWRLLSRPVIYRAR